MARAAWWAVAAVAAAVGVSADGGVDVTFPPGKEELFTISVGGDVWFVNEPVWFQVHGVVYSSAPTEHPTGAKALLRKGPPRSTAGTDAWGSYTTVALDWLAGAAHLTTSVKVYAAEGVVTFSQVFPDGLAVNGTIENENGVASGFPAFRPADLPDVPAAAQRLWMGYDGWDCFDLYGCDSAQGQRVTLGRWQHDTAVLPYGLEGTGPLAVMAADGSTTAVLSASAEFMAVSQQLIPTAASGPPAKLIGEAGHYWNCGHKWAATADNVTLAECQALCAESGCQRFDYASGWPRSTTCGVRETLCHNCRVVARTADGAEAVPSGQGYTAYCVADDSGKACAQPSGGQGVLTYGLPGATMAVEPGFGIEVMLSVGAGPNAAVRRWGQLLTQRYNKTNPEGNDFTTSHLGYDTDNGAFYYYNPEPGKTYEQTLMDVYHYAKRAGIPYRHVQLDSWWYIKDIKGEGGGCKSWTPGPNTFPNGLAQFHAATGWNITAHSRMWSADNVYAKQNNGSYDWYIEGSEGVPLEQRFWDDLLRNATDWGLYVYEQDWLFTEYVGTNMTRQSPTAARDWLLQMGTGAARSKRVIQYCMLWPRMALLSLQIPAVTTARGSTDYKAGGNDQWVMGLSSLFLDSLELRPTKDNYFSTDAQGHGEKGIERFNRLQAVVSTLTTGPVFPSDAINSSDAALIMRACMTDGRLLRPDRAATNIDKNILAKATALGDGTAVPGELESTTVTLDGTTVYAYVLAANTTTASTVALAEVLPAAAAAAPHVAFESNTSGAPFMVDGARPLRLPAGDRWSFQFVTVAPILEGGWVFLGEAATKWIAVSRQRFSGLAATTAGMAVTVTGAPGERVQLAYTRAQDAGVGAAPAAPTLFECVIPPSGRATASMPSGKCV